MIPLELPKVVPTSQLLVAYRLRPIEGLETHLPESGPPPGVTGKEKIAEWQADRRDTFLAQAAQQPHGVTFDEVRLADGARKKVVPFKYEPAGNGKPSIASRVLTYLLTNYGAAWSNEAYVVPSRRPAVVFMGFDPQLFLQVLGWECAKPPSEKPCPFGLWNGNANCIDLMALFGVTAASALGVRELLRIRRPASSPVVAEWDQRTREWSEPGQDLELDIMITMEIATQVGLICKP